MTLIRLARRTIHTIAVGLVVASISFAVMRLVPGDPVAAILGDQSTPEAAASLRTSLGLEGSLPEQFATYAKRLVHLDLGTSLTTRQSVLSIITRSLPPTVSLIATALLFMLVISIPLATFTATRSRRTAESIKLGLAVLVAIPSFFLAIVALLVLAVNLRIAPVAGYAPSFPENLRYLWLPGLVLCGVLVPIATRVLSQSIEETQREEFVETAIVRGISARLRTWRYLLRPSLAPLVGLLGYISGALLGGAVVVELVFDFPGIGTTLIQAVLSRDYPVIQGVLLVFGIVVVLITYAADLISVKLDPRLQL